MLWRCIRLVVVLRCRGVAVSSCRGFSLLWRLAGKKFFFLVHYTWKIFGVGLMSSFLVLNHVQWLGVGVLGFRGEGSIVFHSGGDGGEVFVFG